MKKTIILTVIIGILMSLLQTPTASAATQGHVKFEVVNAEVLEGYATVNVKITENSGLAGFKLTVDFDEVALTPVEVKKGEIFKVGAINSNIKNEDIESLTVFWSGTYNITSTGTAFTIKFKATENFVGETPITLSYTRGDICDQNYNNLYVTLENGTVVANNDAEYLLSNLVYSADGIDVTVTRQNNITEDAVMLIVVYESGILCGIHIEPLNIDNGQQTICSFAYKYDENLTIKAFVWDSLKGMKSISNTICN